MPRLIYKKVKNYWILTSGKKCKASTTSLLWLLCCPHEWWAKLLNYQGYTVAKFTNERIVCDLHKGHSVRKRSGRSEDPVDTVKQAVVRSPKKSIRWLSAKTNLHRCNVQRILRQNIYAFPYKIQSERLLTNEQKEKQLHFANWFAEKLEEDADFLKRLHLTDEFHAHLSGVENKQNFWCWGTENPGNASTEIVPSSVLKATMWVAVGWYGVIGPYFFWRWPGVYLYSEPGKLSRDDLKFLSSWTPCSGPQENKLIKMKTQWFEQDAVPSQTARERRLFLERHFDCCFISLYVTVE